MHSTVDGQMMRLEPAYFLAGTEPLYASKEFPAIELQGLENLRMLVHKTLEFYRRHQVEQWIANCVNGWYPSEWQELREVPPAAKADIPKILAAYSSVEDPKI
jgi:hypothetical protein